MTYHYPSLNEKDINLVIQLYETNPDYFDKPECPYPQNIKDLFKGDLAVLDFDTHTGDNLEMSDDDILKNINSLQSKLSEYWEEVKTSDKGSDKNTFFRVSVALMEKIVSLKREMSAVKDVNDFIHQTLQIMSEILDADQRNEVMERLKIFSDKVKK